MNQEEASSLCKVLGDPTRLRILSMLATGERCVCEFPSVIGISQPAISHHLRRLREVGLVREERRGQWVYYRMQTDRLDALCTNLSRLSQWDPAPIGSSMSCEPISPTGRRKEDDDARNSGH